jgi:3-keto-5-aminohexanoate cleavage enzyme
VLRLLVYRLANWISKFIAMAIEKNNDLIVNLAPTGMIPTRKMTPHVPLTPSEIIADVLKCREIGVTTVHLHARDNNGETSYKKDAYAEIIRGIKNVNKDIVICVSTSGRKFNELEKRSDVLDLDGYLKPDMASLTLSSLNFNQIASVNSPDMIQALAKKMLEKNIKPELEVFDVGMINYAKYLIKKGLLAPPYYFSLILGNIACAQANLMHLGYLINELPADSFYSVGGIGNAQLSMNAVSVAYGGGVRIGIEDNIWFDDERTILATNSDLIQRVVLLAKVRGRSVMDPGTFRNLLRLLPPPKNKRALGIKKSTSKKKIITRK